MMGDVYFIMLGTPSTRLSGFSNASMTFHGLSTHASPFASMVQSGRRTPHLPEADSEDSDNLSNRKYEKLQSNHKI